MKAKAKKHSTAKGNPDSGRTMVIPRTYLEYDRCWGLDSVKKEQYFAGILDEMTEFAFSNPMAYSEERYWAIKGLPRSTFNDAMNEFPALKEKHERIKMLIGVRREDIAFQNNPSIMLKTAAHYHQRYRDEAEWEHKMKNMLADAVSQIIVEMQAPRDTGIKKLPKNTEQEEEKSGD